MLVVARHLSYCQCYWLLLGDTDDEEVFTFPEADPYMEEDLAFIKAVRSGDHTHIRSGYHDAAKTYLLSWAIRRASEKQMM